MVESEKPIDVEKRIRQLVDLGADINASGRTFGKSLFYIAAFLNNQEAGKILQILGAVHHKNEDSQLRFVFCEQPYQQILEEGHLTTGTSRARGLLIRHHQNIARRNRSLIFNPERFWS